ncbi:serine/threonine-protein kinase [Rothia sp. ARF10]|nr:serine/threonine-protein kinase [Rothia sp. ARF10]
MSQTQGRLLGGRYRLGAPLGRGGMAVVWRAQDEMLGREVAVKTLDLTGPDSDNAGERFRREARATAALNHPHIVTVYDTGVEDHTAYLVMELLPGPTLAEQVRDSGPFPVEEVRIIGEEVASALQAAHDAGIVHRDIKPGNIAYAADGTAKVLDFGITQLVDEALGHGHQLTMTDTIVGTAEYLAPEQATGQRVDARADLYALGCVLTTLLTGKPPFSATTPVAILMKHAHEVPPDVRDLRPDTPSDLAGLVAALLAKDPAHRPQSGREVAELLRAHRAPALTEVLPAALGGVVPTTVAPRPEPTEERWSEPAYRRVLEPERRESRAWIWLLLLALALAAAGLWYVLQGRDSDGTETPSTTPTVSRTSEAPSETPTPTPETQTPNPTVTITTTPTPTPSQTPTTPADTGKAVTDATSDFQRSLREARQSGDIEQDVAGTIQDTLRDINTAVKDEDAQAVQSLVDDIEQELSKAAEDGKLTQPGAAALAEPFDTLRQAADAYQP